MHFDELADGSPQHRAEIQCRRSAGQPTFERRQRSAVATGRGQVQRIACADVADVLLDQPCGGAQVQCFHRQV